MIIFFSSSSSLRPSAFVRSLLPLPSSLSNRDCESEPAIVTTLAPSQLTTLLSSALPLSFFFCLSWHQRNLCLVAAEKEREPFCRPTHTRSTEGTQRDKHTTLLALELTLLVSLLRYELSRHHPPPPTPGEAADPSASTNNASSSSSSQQPNSSSRSSGSATVTKSTKGASKMRRDMINAEVMRNLPERQTISLSQVSVLRDLLPLPSSTRQRLSQLQLMALVCVYVRKANYFEHGKDAFSPIVSSPRRYHLPFPTSEVFPHSPFHLRVIWSARSKKSKNGFKREQERARRGASLLFSPVLA